MRFEEKLGHTKLNSEKYIMDLIRNDWKHILRNESSQKPLLKTFGKYEKIGKLPSI